jgi:hypothetical protein
MIPGHENDDAKPTLKSKSGMRSKAKPMNESGTRSGPINQSKKIMMWIEWSDEDAAFIGRDSKTTKLFSGKAEIENWRQQMGPERWDSITPEAAKEGPQLNMLIDRREVAIETYFAKHSVARESDSRVILVGDSAQHRSVERGDALRIPEQSGTVRFVELLQTQRQTVPALKAAKHAR